MTNKCGKRVDSKHIAFMLDIRAFRLIVDAIKNNGYSSDSINEITRRLDIDMPGSIDRIIYDCIYDTIERNDE